MWTDPPTTASLYQDSAGTTAISAIGTVLDTSNPVGLILDRKGGATVKADPGIWMEQATATSRPVASARVNWLTGTESLDQAPWSLISVIPTPAQLAWDGELTACKFAAVASTVTAAGAYQNSFSGVNAVQIMDAKADGVNFIGFIDQTGSNGAVWFDVLNGVVGSQNYGYTGTITPLPNGWFRCTLILPVGVTQPYYQWFMAATDGSLWFNGDGAKGVLLAYPSDGPAGMPYQRVNTASDYDASAGPTYCDLDGTDDGWLSATFTADTAFTDGMDALIAVRRDSAANAVCGLYQSVAEANKVFGIAESGSGSGCVGSGAGTPTVLVDGTQLTGGTAVTRGTLHTALTPGDWHILEFRNLDLSTWTSIGFGLYTSYVLNGGYGGHKVFSNGQDANRDLARAQMAAYFGVTLP